ncbi:MAG: indole-3-glycerol phosphate synthase TrpC [Gemmatimonadaceae bacterium]
MAPTGPLGELIAQSAVRARESALARRELEVIVSSLGAAPSFRAALAGRTVAVIAELKRSSPSKGVLDATLDAGRRSAEYAAAGAAALSILTEPSRFAGSLGDLRDARAAVAEDVPLLRKDFLSDEVQLLEARAYGASAVLLIARALPPARLRTLADAAAALGLDALIEVRNEHELAEALAVRGAVIGVNNRDLETLQVDLAVGARLIPLVPGDRIAVYESGVQNADDVRRAAALGADAVLVGSILSAASDGGAAVGALTGVPRRSRG